MTESAVAVVAPANLPGVGAAAGSDAIEALIIQGDLAKVSPQQRVAYYRSVCESLGLNPFTRPFDYINLDGKLTLYPKRDATDQLRQTRGISITEIVREPEDDSGITRVTARARDIHGRMDEATGEVFTKGMSGQALANARMKAETKAKRRVTLSLVGLGWIDESEIEAARAVRVVVDMETGEIAEEDARRLIPSAADRLAERRRLLEAGTSDMDEVSGPVEQAEQAAVEGQAIEVVEDAQPSEPAVQEPPQSTSAKRAAGAACGEASPWTEGEACGLSAGHSGNHKSGNRESWAPARK